MGRGGPPRPIRNRPSLLALVVLVDYLVVGVVVLLALRLTAAGLTAHVGACLGTARLLVELLADRVEGLLEGLGVRLDSGGVLALEGLLQLVNGGLNRGLLPSPRTP